MIYQQPSISSLIPFASNGLQKKIEPYIEIANQMEAQFLENLIEQMDKTISRVDEQSFQMNFYNSLLFGEHAKKMSKQNMGISNMILQQLVPNELLKDLYKNTSKGNIYGKNSFKQSESSSIQKPNNSYAANAKTQ